MFLLSNLNVSHAIKFTSERLWVQQHFNQREPRLITSQRPVEEKTAASAAVITSRVNYTTSPPFARHTLSAVTLITTKWQAQWRQKRQDESPVKGSYRTLWRSGRRPRRHSPHSFPRRRVWTHSSSPSLWRCPAWPEPGRSPEEPHGRRSRSACCRWALEPWRRSWSEGSMETREVKSTHTVRTHLACPIQLHTSVHKGKFISNKNTSWLIYPQF